ncbi:phospholipase D family member 5 [Rhinolophus ferrumequinum]|uniref:Phospholipase D family member 5 n=1 Tax=Rhinolophus ferrumequinum TaxID=59479 RepID=A0A7J7REY9_RHIFE|nr:phospholipase D family member 5 [Rhinolophus ferrumequinum]
MDSQKKIAKINVGKSIALVENIPEGLNYSENAPFHLSLFQGWMNLLNMAKKSVDIVSSHWDLNHSHPSACQGQRLFEKLLQLTSQNIEIKLVSDVTADSKVLEALKLKGKAKVDMLLYHWYSVKIL